VIAAKVGLRAQREDRNEDESGTPCSDRAVELTDLPNATNGRHETWRQGLCRKNRQGPPRPHADFIRHERLLPADEIDLIEDEAQLDPIRFQDVSGGIPREERPAMRDWLDRFNAGLPQDGRIPLAA
jgi:hypothetical protein